MDRPADGDDATARSSAKLTPFAVITGGSDGIGLALAERLHRQGQAVLLVARDEARLAQAGSRIRAIPTRDGAPAAVETISLDIGRPEAPEAIQAAVARAGGHVNLLINNAGIGLAGPFERHDPARLEDLLAVNVLALTRLMRHFLPQMKKVGRGGIINLASLGGYIPGPNQSAYYASKAYVISLSEAVASEAKPFGVHVLVVSPGPVSTGFHGKMGAEESWYRWVMPTMRPATVAAWTLTAYRLGLKSVCPGVLNSLMRPILRILPHPLIVPVVGWLLRAKALEGRDV